MKPPPPARLERDDVQVAAGARQVDAAEFALAEWPADLEMVQ